MAWAHYPAMLAVEELELETGDMQYLVHTKKLITCVVFWPVVEVLNAGFEFYLNYIKKGAGSASSSDRGDADAQ